jgi:hypothetical protein
MIKYAIKYYKDCRVLNKADEVIIIYDKRDPELIKFLEDKNENQRYIINITSLELDEIKENIEIFKGAYISHPNISFMLKDVKGHCIFKDAGIPFFFDTKIQDTDVLYEYVKLGVSDVYLVNEICFSLRQIAPFCKGHQVKIRVFPNIAQKSIGEKDLKSFFIRPEDIEEYNEYIDICEFEGSLDRQAVYYEIYTEGKWAGNLNEIIIGLKTEEPIDNSAIIPTFVQPRLGCMKRCNYEKCQSCDIVKTISEPFKNGSTLVFNKKDK